METRKAKAKRKARKEGEKRARLKRLPLATESLPFALISREAARTAGLTHFFSGEPCINGHVAERWVNGGRCMECVRVNAARYYKTHMKRVRARQKRRHEANPEKHYIRTSRYSREHRKELNAARARRHEANPWLRRAHVTNRRAREYGANGILTTTDLERIFDQQSGICAAPHCDVPCCHVDHKTSLYRNGSNYPRNIQLLCAFCSISKSEKTQKEWLRWLRRKRREQERKAHAPNRAS